VKAEQLIVQHLYQAKKVSLQGIGTITLNPAVALPLPGDKDYSMPDNAFGFEYNPKAGEDEELVNFIVQQTRKIKPLASSDMESYCILAKQFLNIGKPLILEGVGTIQKNQAGTYEFLQGSFVHQKIEEAPKALKEKTEEAVSFESEPVKDKSRKNILLLFLIIVAALAGLGIYYWYTNTVANTIAEPITNIPVTDTIKKDTTPVKQPDTIVVKQAIDSVVKKDSFTFKIVLKEYSNLEAANTAYKKLTSYGHKLLVVSTDSSHHLLAMPFMQPIADTARARDSLRKFFGGKPYIIIN
jgi:hypothetical protein